VFTNYVLLFVGVTKQAIVLSYRIMCSYVYLMGFMNFNLLFVLLLLWLYIYIYIYIYIINTSKKTIRHIIILNRY
jgi:hypothetical protein